MKLNSTWVVRSPPHGSDLPYEAISLLHISTVYPMMDGAGGFFFLRAWTQQPSTVGRMPVTVAPTPEKRVRRTRIPLPNQTCATLIGEEGEPMGGKFTGERRGVGIQP
jgi:hypothetical protein